jgi:hypothetical protein
MDIMVTLDRSMRVAVADVKHCMKFLAKYYCERNRRVTDKLAN